MKEGHLMSQQSKKKLTANLIYEYVHFFRCPVCSNKMELNNDHALICTKGHSYDLAKKGYIHMLSQSTQTKYDKALFQSRQKMAETGFFTPLVKAIAKLIEKEMSHNAAILDAGCGEGSHLVKLQSELGSSNMIGFGADISKEGIQLAARNQSKTIWLVADLAHCPLASDSFQFILNILSPSNYSEFERLLKKDGLLLKVVPNRDYLQELRQLFFKKKESFDNEQTLNRFQERFDLVGMQDVRYKVKLEQPYLDHLVKMTPLSWSVSQDQLQKISGITGMDITVDFKILIGKRNTK